MRERAGKPVSAASGTPPSLPGSGLTERPSTSLVWINGAPLSPLRTTSASVDDDWNHSSRTRLYQSFDHLLKTRRPAQLCLSCCGNLERQTRSRLSVYRVCSPRALLLHFGLSPEEASHTEGRCSQLLSLQAPNNPRNAGSTVARQTPGAHTRTTQGARKKMY